MTLLKLNSCKDWFILEIILTPYVVYECMAGHNSIFIFKSASTTLEKYDTIIIALVSVCLRMFVYRRPCNLLVYITPISWRPKTCDQNLTDRDGCLSISDKTSKHTSDSMRVPWWFKAGRSDVQSRRPTLSIVLIWAVVEKKYSFVTANATIWGDLTRQPSLQWLVRHAHNG